MKKTLTLLYQLGAGLCDITTGLLLIFAPALTLRLMGVAVTPQPAVFTGYIGAFVGGVGLSYLWLLAARRLTDGSAWRTHWAITAIIRAAVAFFVVAAFVQHQLDAKWLSVAATDGAFATLQCAALMGGWLERAAADAR